MTWMEAHRLTPCPELKTSLLVFQLHLEERRTIKPKPGSFVNHYYGWAI